MSGDGSMPNKVSTLLTGVFRESCNPTPCAADETVVYITCRSVKSRSSVSSETPRTRFRGHISGSQTFMLQCLKKRHEPRTNCQLCRPVNHVSCHPTCSLQCNCTTTTSGVHKISLLSRLGRVRVLFSVRLSHNIPLQQHVFSCVPLFAWRSLACA